MIPEDPKLYYNYYNKRTRYILQNNKSGYVQDSSYKLRFRKES